MSARQWQLARVMQVIFMTSHGMPALSDLVKRSGIGFFTRRVLQRWLRGEISTDTAVELIQSDDAGRIIGTWTSSRV